MGNTLSNSMKILKKIGKIESGTKIIYSPKYNGDKKIIIIHFAHLSLLMKFFI